MISEITSSKILHDKIEVVSVLEVAARVNDKRTLKFV
jgi:hypothetical protein